MLRQRSGRDTVDRSGYGAEPARGRRANGRVDEVRNSLARAKARIRGWWAKPSPGDKRRCGLPDLRGGTQAVQPHLALQMPDVYFGCARLKDPTRQCRGTAMPR